MILSPSITTCMSTLWLKSIIERTIRAVLSLLPSAWMRPANWMRRRSSSEALPSPSSASSIKIAL